MLEMKTWQENYKNYPGCGRKHLCAGKGIIHSMAGTLRCLYCAGRKIYCPGKLNYTERGARKLRKGEILCAGEWKKIVNAGNYCAKQENYTMKRKKIIKLWGVRHGQCNVLERKTHCAKKLNPSGRAGKIVLCRGREKKTLCMARKLYWTKKY